MEAQSSSLIPHWHDPEIWSTHRVAGDKQFDRWREFVIDAHMHWSIRPVKCDRFPAYMRQGRLDGFRVTHLTALHGGVIGTRGEREIAQDSEALYNLIYIAEGSICLAFGGDEVVLTPGTFTLWDTTRPMTFITGKGLRQITFAVPQALLRRVLPRAADCVGHRVNARRGVSRLFADHLLSLDSCFGELPRDDAGHILSTTMELLASTLHAEIRLPEPCTSGVLLRQVMTYIDQHLDDPELSTQEIAQRNHISQRHLHRLFHDAGTTPAAWVRRQRLDRCRRDLSSAAASHLSITDIAYRWGFRESGTFSKVFRREYGICPRAFRAETERGEVSDR